MHAGISRSADVKNMEKLIRDIKAKNEDLLMTIPGIVSVGVGRDDAGNPALVIGVEAEEYCERVVLPEELQSCPIKFMVVGTIKAR